MSRGADSGVTAAASAAERYDRVQMFFEPPQRDIVPGLAAVFCVRGEPDRLIGGGLIVHDAGAQHG